LDQSGLFQCADVPVDGRERQLVLGGQTGDRGWPVGQRVHDGPALGVGQGFEGLIELGGIYIQVVDT